MSRGHKDLATVIAVARRDLSGCQDRLRSRWIDLSEAEALFLRPGSDRNSLRVLLSRLRERLEEDHATTARALGQLHWACRVDAGPREAPSLVSEQLNAAIGQGASLAAQLEAARHAVVSTLAPEGDLEASLGMCRRFLSAAQHDLGKVVDLVAEVATLIPEPSPRWHLRPVS